MTDRKPTKEEQRAKAALMAVLLRIDRDIEGLMLKDKLIPPEWRKLHETAPCVPKKTKVTFRLDDRLVRWFRHMGTGWHGRVEAVLLAYMHAVVSKEIERPEDRDWHGDLI